MALISDTKKTQGGSGGANLDEMELMRQSSKELTRRLSRVLTENPDDDNSDKTDESLAQILFGTDVPLANLKDESVQDWYRKTAGMHTVQKWCENYNKHPYAWGALIMIHGTDEVCFRLRTKVENYAVYSALFLSASIVLGMDPNSAIIG